MKRDVVMMVLMLMFVITAWVFAGGPWTQPAGSGYGQVSFTGIFSYDRLYTEDGSGITLNRNVSDITLLGYFEYGLTDKLTLIAHVPYKMVKTDEGMNAGGDFPNTLASGSLSGFGNPALAAKINFIRGTVLVSGQMQLDAKIITEEQYTGLRTGYPAWSFTPTVIVGGGTHRFYAFAEAAVRLRSDDYSNDFMANIEAGYLFFGRLWLAGAGDILQTISDGVRPADGSQQTGLYANGQEYVAYGFKLILVISRDWGINASSFSAGSGHLVPKSAPFTLGLYYRW
ncbi:MAG: hypothetical protein GWN16_16140 [Calditrichae bacterium]|nr:hypothetical protein [Calditrichia bacterium]